MKYTVIIDDAVYPELERCAVWMETQRSGYGLLLLNAYDEAIYHLEAYPYSHRIRKKKWRIIKLSWFNYVLVYKVYDETVFIGRLIHATTSSRKKYTFKSTRY